MNKTFPALFVITIIFLTACTTGTQAPTPTGDINARVEGTLTQAAADLLTPAPAQQTPLPPAATPTMAPVEGDPVTILGEPDGMDTFDNFNNWSKFNNDCFANDIQDGRFLMTARGMANIACWTFNWPQMADFYVETIVQNPGECQPDDSFGMIFRAPDNLKGYLVGLTCDGRMGLLNWDGQTATNIIPWLSHPAINLGLNAVNRIGIGVYGTEFQMYANGHFMGQAQDNIYTEPGKLGYYVFASTQSAFTTKYDDLAVWLLSDRYIPPGSNSPAPPDGAVPPPGANVPTATTTTYVNVRSGPGTNYPVYFVAQPGTTFEVSGVSPDGEWWAVKVSTDIVESGQAWVSADYTAAQGTENVPVIPPPPPPPTVNPPPPDTGQPTGVALEPLNVRAGPSTIFISYGVVAKGTSGEIVGKSPDGVWWAVKLPADVAPEGYGWVHGAYVKATNAENVPVIEPPV